MHSSLLPIRRVALVPLPGFAVLSTLGWCEAVVLACRGKAILPWTPTPDEAIAATCHLNHKYALDGCDPCSYGGILWCYGLFDKPMGAPFPGLCMQSP
jgi:hypothetical protein